jgi:hypothetical protein
MLSDIPAHRSYILGNVGQLSLRDIYFGEAARKVKDAASQASPSLPPCRHCQYYWPSRLADFERRKVVK